MCPYETHSFFQRSINASPAYPYYVVRGVCVYGAPGERLQINLHTLLRSLSNIYLQASCLTCCSFVDLTSVLNLFHGPRATATKGVLRHGL